MSKGLVAPKAKEKKSLLLVHCLTLFDPKLFYPLAKKEKKKKMRGTADDTWGTGKKRKRKKKEKHFAQPFLAADLREQ